jgi:hypothetical protein
VSKKRHDKTRSKHRSQAKTHTDWTHRIFLAARDSIQPSVITDFRQTEERDVRLFETVAQALDTGTDKHVLRAMEDLEEAHLEDAAEKVSILAEIAATTMPVIGQTASGSIESGELRLFVVPMLIMVEAGHAFPMCVPDDVSVENKDGVGPSPLTLLETSLRRHGLVGKAPSVMTLPWLYAYSDLPETWSGRRGMLRQILHGLGGQPTRIPTPKQQPPVKQPTLAIRFLVFATFSALEDEDIGPLLDIDTTDGDPESDRQFEAWQAELNQRITESLPGVLFAEAGIPSGWSDAIHAGITMHNLHGLANAVVPPAAPTTHASMGVYLVDGGPELRIGIARNGKFSGGFVWVCHQDPKEEIEDAILALEQMGVPSEQIHVASEIFFDERCPDCGEPYFPNVTTEGLHDHRDEYENGDGESGHSWLH